MADEDTPQNESERNLTKLLAKKDGDAMALAADLLTENAQLRADKRMLKRDMDALGEKVPGEDTRVLSKDEAAEFEAYRALELKPAALKTKLDEAETFRTKATTLERQTLVSKIARDNGWDEDVLGEQLAGKELQVEGEGDAAVYKLALGEGKSKAVDAYIKEDRAKYLPALQVTPERKQVFTGAGRGEMTEQDPVKSTLDSIYSRGRT